VVVVLDEVPAISLMDARERIDARLYPNLARLARDATWFPKASTVNAGTIYAVPAILTGRQPPVDSLPHAPDHPRSLFTLLGRSYHRNVSEPYSDVCPRRLCPEPPPAGFPERLRLLVRNSVALGLRGAAPAHLDDRLPELEQVARVDHAEQVRRFVKDIRRHSSHTLHFIHLLLPHQPFKYLPSGSLYDEYFERYADVKGREGGTFRRRPFLVAQRYQRHLAQLAFADRLLGRILDRLRATGLYGRALVVVLSDHGISFRPGESLRVPSKGNLEQIASVPLLIKLPGQRRARVRGFHARVVDVLPTIADVIGAPLPWPVEGRSLLRVGADRSRIALKEKDKPLGLPAHDFDRRLRAALDHKLRLFAPGGRSRLFALGPRPDLVGRTLRLRSLPRIGGGRLSLYYPRPLRSVDPGSGFLPARVGGYLRGTGLHTGAPLAVAVNGRVWATTRAFRGSGGALAFTALLPERALRRGSNRVSVLSLDAGAPRVIPVKP
jgi:hypothetical protein